MAPATMDDQRPDQATHFPFQVSAMASITLSDNVLNATETATVTFTFDADYALAPANITAIGGTLSTPVAFPAGQSRVWQATFTPATAATQRADCTITVNNDAGGVLAQSNSFTVDNVRPDIIDFDIPPVIASSGDVVVSFSITFDEPVDASNPKIFSTAGGRHSFGTSSNGGRTWTYQWWPRVTEGRHPIGIRLYSVKDLAGNEAANKGADSYHEFIRFDSQRPTVSTVSMADRNLSAGEETTITIVFSKALNRTSFTTDDLRVAPFKGQLSDLRTTDGITWTVKLRAPAALPDADNGVSTGNRIQINMAGLADVPGNTGAGGWTDLGTADTASYRIDIAPTVTAIDVPSATIHAGQDPVTITIHFNKPVTGLTSANIDLTNASGTLASGPTSTDGRTWTFTFSPTANTDDSSNTIRINLDGITDATGSAATDSAARTSGNFSIDTVRPTVTITLDDSRLCANETAVVTFAFSERVNGFSMDKVDTTGAQGSLSDLTPVGTDGRVWTATFTPTAERARTPGRITVDMDRITDAAGSTGTGKTPSQNYTVDTRVFAIRDATVNGTRLVLRYSDETHLDADPAHGAPTTAFTVLVDGRRVGVQSLAVDAAAKTVTLTLADAVSAGQTVTVAYTDPSTGNDLQAVQEAGTGATSGDDAASFAARPVTNLLTPPAPTPSPATDSGRDGANPNALDSDYDSVPNAQENQAPGLLRPDGSAGLDGDGNGDDIRDSQQVAVGSTRDLTLVAGSQDGKVIPGSNARISELVRSDAPASLPEGMEMPLGLTPFKVGLAEGRSTESFSLYVDPATGATGYWVKNGTGIWVNLASAPYGGKMSTEGGRTRLDFQIQDGGQYDADGLADGHITALGAAAKMPLSIVGQSPHVESGSFWF
ncbi:hypothetical protein D8B34_14930 [Verminephrobacter eiseniae]|nr:hypothetical protein [Verminephrobacter eiseniae]MCW5296059.1 hypothetical protein [Verminephrobacter eiseniae]MCW8185255.1 hypothetical protein [Verminephrobacter eiseniae]MCW8224361.1 hypothetical protein [Verminephrobacter eiseniae]MCW8235015.1 hypothetical protein [Verminephrobacter eiseniae]